jgi:NAD(P)H-hydrate epimerase
LKLALDLPSGLDPDTGACAGEAFRADVSVTFAAAKPGFDAPGAERWTGVVVVADIGLDARFRAAGA